MSADDSDFSSEEDGFLDRRDVLLLRERAPAEAAVFAVPTPTSNDETEAPIHDVPAPAPATRPNKDEFDRIVEFRKPGPDPASITRCNTFLDITGPERGLVEIAHLYLKLVPSVLAAVLPQKIFPESARTGPFFFVAPTGKTSAIPISALSHVRRRKFPSPASAFAMASKVVLAAPRVVVICQSTAKVSDFRCDPLLNATKFHDHKCCFLQGPLTKEDMGDIIGGCDVLVAPPRPACDFFSGIGNYLTGWMDTLVFFDDVDQSLKRTGDTMLELFKEMRARGIDLHRNSVFLSRCWTREIDHLWSEFSCVAGLSRRNSDSGAGGIDSQSGPSRDSTVVFVTAETICATFMDLDALGFFFTKNEKQDHFKQQLGRLAGQKLETSVFAKSPSEAALVAKIVAEHLRDAKLNVEVRLMDERVSLPPEYRTADGKRCILVWSDASWARHCLEVSFECSVHWDLGSHWKDFSRRLAGYVPRWESAYRNAMLGADPLAFRKSKQKALIYVAVDEESGELMEKVDALLGSLPETHGRRLNKRRIGFEGNAQKMFEEAVGKFKAGQNICPEVLLFGQCYNPAPVCLRHELKRDLALEKKFPKGAVVKVQCYHIEDGSCYTGLVQAIDPRLPGKAPTTQYLVIRKWMQGLTKAVKAAKDAKEPEVRPERGRTYALYTTLLEKDFGMRCVRVRVLNIRGVPGKLEYELFHVDFGVVHTYKETQHRGEFYPVPVEFRDCPPWPVTFINMDVCPVDKASYWVANLGREWIGRALNPDGVTFHASQIKGYFVGKVYLVAEKRVYLTDVVADDAVYDELPDLSRREKLVSSMVRSGHAMWRPRLPDPGPTVVRQAVPAAKEQAQPAPEASESPVARTGNGTAEGEESRVPGAGEPEPVGASDGYVSDEVSTEEKAEEDEGTPRGKPVRFEHLPSGRSCQYRVHCSRFLSNAEFYVRLVDKKEELQELERKMLTWAEKQQKLGNDCGTMEKKAGDLFVLWRGEGKSKKCSRAVYKSGAGETCLWFAVDTGEIVMSSDRWAFPFPAEFLSLPFQALPCEMKSDVLIWCGSEFTVGIVSTICVDLPETWNGVATSRLKYRVRIIDEAELQFSPELVFNADEPFLDEEEAEAVARELREFLGVPPERQGTPSDDSDYESEAVETVKPSPAKPAAVEKQAPTAAPARAAAPLHLPLPAPLPKHAPPVCPLRPGVGGGVGVKWKEPLSVEWVDCETFLVLNIDLPILHKDNFLLTSDGTNFSLVTAQDALYKWEFRFFCHVRFAEMEVTVNVLEDRERGKFVIKIPKVLPGPWDMLSGLKERKRFRFLRRGTAHPFLEEERERIEEMKSRLDPESREMFDADPTLRLSELPELSRDEQRHFETVRLPEVQPCRDHPNLPIDLDMLSDDSDEELEVDKGMHLDELKDDTEDNEFS